MDRLQTLALGSIGVGTLVLALKYAAFHVTGSVALYSDALESIINVVAAVVAFFALRVAPRRPTRPPLRPPQGRVFLGGARGGAHHPGGARRSCARPATGILDAQARRRSRSSASPSTRSRAVVNGAWSWLLIRRGRRLALPGPSGRWAARAGRRGHLRRRLRASASSRDRLHHARPDRGGPRGRQHPVVRLGHGAARAIERPHGRAAPAEMVARVRDADLRPRRPARSRRTTCAPATPAG